LDFLENKTVKSVSKTTKRVISWVTGQKI